MQFPNPMYAKFYCPATLVGSVVTTLLEVEDASHDWAIEKKLVCFECRYESPASTWSLHWPI